MIQIGYIDYRKGSSFTEANKGHLWLCLHRQSQEKISFSIFNPNLSKLCRFQTIKKMARQKKIH